ncbi:MAG: hypothetical protein KBD60_03310 [Sterolibacterium sp.]|jgi:hypothetical protein|nr:hypothetical protein [Sterolibacterium sp.]
MQPLALAFHQNTNAPAAAQRPSLVPQLRQLANQLSAAIQAGQSAQARRLAHRYSLPPIAWGFLASCLQQQSIPGEVIESVLS